MVLISAGMTLELHGGGGPDTRPWTGRNWQAKTFVYILGTRRGFVALASRRCKRMGSERKPA